MLAERHLDPTVEHVEIDEPWLRLWHVNAEAQRIYPPTTAIQRLLPLASDRLKKYRKMARSRRPMMRWKMNTPRCAHYWPRGKRLD
ncbi:hypothetical protein [Burkholderia ubonensis]|uniref:hypothetical protein n=1 Tax=Burkholderia ubonensis TaxID=101571 RepID=UPI000A57E90C|nr:hypothetical protein [Burkholderia ubonensis]